MKKYFQLLISLVIVFYLLSPWTSNSLRKYILGPTESHKTIYVSSDFDLEDYILVQQAAQSWRDETHGLVTFNVKYGFDMTKYLEIRNDPNSMVMTRATPDDPLVNSIDKKMPSPILGYFLSEFQTQNILLVPGRMLNEDYYRSVMMHEMGHSIGLNHIEDDPDTVMYPYMSYTYRLTKKDIEWFCKAYYCDASKLGGTMYPFSPF